MYFQPKFENSKPKHQTLRLLLLMTMGVSGPWSCLVCVRKNSRTHFDRPLGVSNKASLQNQLQNPRIRNSEKSNETFDRVIRGWLQYLEKQNMHPSLTAEI